MSKWEVCTQPLVFWNPYEFLLWTLKELFVGHLWECPPLKKNETFLKNLTHLFWEMYFLYFKILIDLIDSQLIDSMISLFCVFSSCWMMDLDHINVVGHTKWFCFCASFKNSNEQWSSMKLIFFINIFTVTFNQFN